MALLPCIRIICSLHTFFTCGDQNTEFIVAKRITVPTYKITHCCILFDICNIEKFWVFCDWSVSRKIAKFY